MATSKLPKEYAQVAAVAEQMLSGQIHYLDGALQLSRLRHAVGAYENDPDFFPFIGINHEIDNLPIPGGFEYADQTLRNQYESEINASVEWAKAHSLHQCQALAERFG
ncbi:hypothetical protein [Neptuniibacter caesariensis]|uniref:DUF2489 domain-containing protein n=1 Tax=Neptuniibacter caesariensis TaxID=207954 RepID=A0A7U8C5P9_NEPCE|nr:hypothetical protein [Neptuniibacter caesariensis]EAR61988.1 hypothetical protein MED92_03533 [Oceanospirillum sp. MED92] [Neptuniibacter caesariensis]